jgi:type VI secretion system protein ImpC
MADQQSEPGSVKGNPVPQVHITYEVETGSTFEGLELPLVVGILADVSGNDVAAQPAGLFQRDFIHIDHGTFDKVIAAINPRLSFTVENALGQAGGTRRVNLSFNSLDDFSPRRIVDQVEDLKGLDELDPQLHAQLNLILQAPELQKLEATWRGLQQLVMYTSTDASLKLRLLDVTREALRLDLEEAVAFDQSALFTMLYQAKSYGGEPFSVLMGDFEFGRSQADIAMLNGLASVAAAVHAPFIAAASAQLFDLQSFAGLGDANDLAATFEGDAMADWRALQAAEDSRYLCLTLPRYLSRRPYDPIDNPVAGLPTFIEHASASSALWGNAAWLLTQRIADSFARHRWWAETLGTDGAPVFNGPTEVAISAGDAQALDALGFVALTHRPDSNGAVFAGCQSLHKPQAYNTPEANANAMRCVMVPYLLGASRFAHYLAVIISNKIGSLASRSTVESYLNAWVSQYVLLDDNPSPAIAASYPLRQAQVSVADVPGAPGSYSATAFLQPHFQLQGLTTSIRLVIALPTPSDLPAHREPHNTRRLPGNA